MEVRLGCFLLLLIAMGAFLQRAQGTTWKVGDSKGWGLNVDYSLWEMGKVFNVDDTLFFSYNKSSENLLEVSAADYSSCTTIAPIHEYTDGNTSVLLQNLTARYFISGIPGHCVDGVNLQIHMGIQAPSPAPSIPAAPVPAPSPTPTTNSAPLQSAPPLQQSSPPPPPLPSLASPRLSVLPVILISMATGAALILQNTLLQK